MTKSNKMWGGRFEAQADDIMTEINASIDVDQRLWQQDIAGSKAHAKMLVAQNIISAEDEVAIQNGLDNIAEEIKNGEFEFKVELEDIHMNIEHRLNELIGEPAGRLHTGRSRNDQVATDFRLWVREACDHLTSTIETLQNTLQDLSKEHDTSVMPGFTHLQVAQPVTLGVHLDAYWHMLDRDKSRIEDCRKRLNQSPLGAAALAGTPFPIDRELTTQELGFDRPMSNTMDAVSARDFAIEFLFCCTQCGMNLSRLAEEIILWSTAQFGYITLSDDWATGSSIMPQKKNPDAAELVRAKTGRLTGNLVQLLMVLKALPLTYNKDLQEDKSAVFESFDALTLCLQATNGMISGMTVHKDIMREDALSGFSTATRLADWLVMNLNIPFREAHHITGQIVKLAEAKKCRLDELKLEDMKSIEQNIHEDVFNALKI